MRSLSRGHATCLNAYIYLSITLTETLYVFANVTQGGETAIDHLQEEFLAASLSSLGRTEDLHARRVVKALKL